MVKVYGCLHKRRRSLLASLRLMKCYQPQYLKALQKIQLTKQLDGFMVTTMVTRGFIVSLLLCASNKFNLFASYIYVTIAVDNNY